MGFRKQRTKKKIYKRKSKNRVFVSVFRIAVLLCVIGLFALIGAVLGAYVGILQSTAGMDEMKLIPQNQSSIVYYKNGEEIDRLHAEQNRIYAKLGQIPINLQHAIIAVEDQRFYDHNGIDMKGIMRAAVKNLSQLSLREGASTITQQLIKNNVLKDKRKKFQRKIQEQFLAVKIEEILTEKMGRKEAKDYILELYLNSINLGGNFGGVQSAANGYFNKDVSELSLAECAALAGITKSPNYYSPTKNFEANQERQQLILKLMLEQSYITQEEYDIAMKEDLKTRIDETKAVTKELKTNGHSYYMDAIIEQVIDDLVLQQIALNRFEASNLVYSSGLRIYSTIDPNIQRIMNTSFEDPRLIANNSTLELTYVLSIMNENDKTDVKHFERSTQFVSEEEIEHFKEKVKEELIKEPYIFLADAIQVIPQPQAAAVIMDHHNGEVKGLIGGRGEKTIARSFNRATQATRQPGSTFKVLAAYVPAVDIGLLSPASIVIDEPYVVPGWKNYKPKNYNNKYIGPTSIRYAIQQSINTIAVRTIMDVGLETSFNYLKNMGFQTLVEKSPDGRSDKVPALALGGMTNGVTVLELTAAFASIANRGNYIAPSLYTSVTDLDGNEILKTTKTEKRVMKESTAFLITDMMKDAIQKGTGAGAYFPGMNLAGKTGTTSDDKDKWFVGYSPYYTASVWVGHDKADKKVEKNARITIWKSMMSKIHQNLPNKAFDMPSNITTATVCALTGKLANPALCTSRITDYFASDQVPTEYCTGHEIITQFICDVSGKIATQFCDPDHVHTVPVEDISKYELDENGKIIYHADDLCPICVERHKEESETNEHSQESTTNISESETQSQESQTQPPPPTSTPTESTEQDNLYVPEEEFYSDTE